MMIDFPLTFELPASLLDFDRLTEEELRLISTDQIVRAAESVAARRDEQINNPAVFNRLQYLVNYLLFWNQWLLLDQFTNKTRRKLCQ